MSYAQVIYVLVASFWSLAVLQGAFLLRAAVRLWQSVGRAVREAGNLRDSAGHFTYQPKVAVILPCCGVDERLHHTVESLSQQNYGDYEVIFTFESEHDPAYAAVTAWTSQWQHTRTQRVIAGLAEHRGQKVHNLLAAVDAASRDRDVLVFLDSDAVPNADWLGYLVAPLADSQISAATGFRWYAAAGGLANGIRSCWNAASLTLINDKKRGFVWGGSTAIRRETFNRLNIARYWDGALSDDLQMSRALRDASAAIVFVPQAMVPSHEATDFRSFWTFARRQVLITRICAPAVWRYALALCLNFVLGGTAVAALFIAAALGWAGDATTMWIALAGWAAIVGIACANALLRQLAVRKVLTAPDVTWRDMAWDVWGTTFMGMLHLSLMMASLRSRRLIWRSTEYELVSPEETRIIRRLDLPPSRDNRDSTQELQSAGFVPH